MDDRPTIDPTKDALPRVSAAPRAPRPALVVVWAREEEGRVGEVVTVERKLVLGRGGARPDDPAPRALFVRQRPTGDLDAGPLTSPRLSRLQLTVEPSPDGAALVVEGLGRRGLTHNGAPVARATARLGDTVGIEDELLFVVAARPTVMPAAPSWPAEAAFAFGAPDLAGVVGESPAAWLLRERLAFAARADAHVLLLGPSGAGKELAAQAIHLLSSRRGKALVARNAATFPETLIDSELFGNARGYPNPGTPERPGLVGEADGGTLFLDEIGELPTALQAHLLRVLDARGEYQRLGEARARRADLRLVAATNRPVEALKHDLAARLALRVTLPSLAERVEDVPLLLAHLAARAAKKLGGAPPAPTAELVDALVRHRFVLEVRELDQLLWQALSESPPGRLELTGGVRARLAAPPATTPAPAAPVERPEPTRDEIAAAMATHGGSVSRAARALGLASRYVLYRLLKKHGLEAGPDTDDA